MQLVVFIVIIYAWRMVNYCVWTKMATDFHLHPVQRMLLALKRMFYKIVAVMKSSVCDHCMLLSINYEVSCVCLIHVCLVLCLRINV